MMIRVTVGFDNEGVPNSVTPQAACTSAALEALLEHYLAENQDHAQGGLEESMRGEAHLKAAVTFMRMRNAGELVLSDGEWDLA